MPSTIFTRTLGAVLIAGAAQADPSGCFSRAYAPEHLATHPEQVVASIWLKVEHSDQYGETYGTMRVVAADGGHAARAGQGGEVFDQYLICFNNEDGFGCAVECDGGSFRLTRDEGDMIEITTDYLMVGDTEGCGGAMDLAERPGTDTPVTYRLYRADDAACEVN